MALFIAIAGGIREIKPGQNIVTDLRSAYQTDLSEVQSKAERGIEIEHQDFMRTGEKNSLNQTIVDIMREGNGTWYGPSDYDLYQDLADFIGRVTTGAAINLLWEFDRAYFVEVYHPSGCEVVKKSYTPPGPPDYLVCLPELPYKGFWLYSIDRGHDDDRDEAAVRGPTGFWRLGEDSSKYSNLTLEDVARSSKYVHQRELIQRRGQRIDVGPVTANSILNGTADEHADIKGVFTIPICENPGGEAISGVLDEDGQNYPCICGQSWDDEESYSFIDDKTAHFLALSGLMFSNDWNAWCDHQNDCSSDSDNDVRSYLEGFRDPIKDPQIAENINHLFKKCEDRKDSRKHPGYPERDRDPNWSEAKRAMLNGMSTNSTRQGISFEA